jgi:DNA-directed RNA polymerase specialized sigma24 family protein
MDGFTSHMPSPEQHAWHREIGVAHEKAVCRLSPHLRAAYALYAESELSIAEIAQTLGLSIAATKSRVFRARSAMRVILGNVWPGEGNGGSTEATRRAA